MPRLPVAPSAVHPILVGTRVPDVALMAADGSPMELAAALSGKPTVLVIYRGGW